MKGLKGLFCGDFARTKMVKTVLIYDFVFAHTQNAHSGLHVDHVDHQLTCSENVKIFTGSVRNCEGLGPETSHAATSIETRKVRQHILEPNKYTKN